MLRNVVFSAPTSTPDLGPRSSQRPLPTLEGQYTTLLANGAVTTITLWQVDTFLSVEACTSSSPSTTANCAPPVPVMMVLPTGVPTEGPSDDPSVLSLKSLLAQDGDDNSKLARALFAGNPLQDVPDAGAIAINLPTSLKGPEARDTTTAMTVQLYSTLASQLGVPLGDYVLRRKESPGGTSTAEGRGHRKRLLRTVAGLVEAVSRRHLESNECCGQSAWGMDFCFFRPANEKYPDFQWQWDESMHMTTWAHLDSARARRSMQTMLSMQQSDGRVPQIIFWLPESSVEVRWLLGLLALLFLSCSVLLVVLGRVLSGKGGVLDALSPAKGANTSSSSCSEQCSSKRPLLEDEMDGGMELADSDDEITPLQSSASPHTADSRGSGSCVRRCCYTGWGRGVGRVGTVSFICCAVIGVICLGIRYHLPPAITFSNPQVSDLIQTPLLPWALQRLASSPEGLDAVREFAPSLVAYFDWWANTRDADGDGLVSILHPWESGLDSSPMYDAYHEQWIKQDRHDPTGEPAVAEVGWGDPSWGDIYPHFGEILQLYSGSPYNWDQEKILSRKGPGLPFHVKDVGVNAVYAAGWAVLRDLLFLLPSEEVLSTSPSSGLDTMVQGTAHSLGEHCDSMYRTSLAAIEGKLWSSERHRFVSLFVLPPQEDEGEKNKGSPCEVPLAVEGVQTLFPLLLRDLDPTMVSSLVHTQVMNPSKFWTRFPINSVSADSPSFVPVFRDNLMWRGPTWPILNWIVTEGLVLHGFQHEAQELVLRWMEMVMRAGIWEQYNPQTGAGYGPRGLGMSTSLVDALRRSKLLIEEDER